MELMELVPFQKATLVALPVPVTPPRSAMEFQVNTPLPLVERTSLLVPSASDDRIPLLSASVTRLPEKAPPKFPKVMVPEAVRLARLERFPSLPASVRENIVPEPSLILKLPLPAIWAT